MDADPVASAALNDSMTFRQNATSSGSGANMRFAGVTCEGWMQIFPWKPRRRAVRQSASKPWASRTAM
jgi:hypothetical protein